MDTTTLQSLLHAAQGAVVTIGSLTIAQNVLSRSIQSPSGFALSVGTFVGVFRALESKCRGKDAKEVRLKRAAAAAIAAVFALRNLDEGKRTTLTSFVSVEAIVTIAHEYFSSEIVKPVGLTSIVACYCHLIYSWIYRKDIFPPSQLATLDHFSSLSKDVLHQMRQEIPSKHVSTRCDVFHPGQSCSTFHLDFLVQCLPTSMRALLPIYAVTVVLPRLKTMATKRDGRQAKQVAQSFLRSSTCLTTMYYIPLTFSCHAPHVPSLHRLVVLLAGCMSPLALAFETPNRRESVAKASCAYSLSAASKRLSLDYNWSSKTLQVAQYIVFALAMAGFVSHPHRQNKRLMRWIYGRDWTEEEAKEKVTC